MYKGTGSEELEGWLDLMLKGGQSKAGYTLVYYEGITDKSAVNNKTAFDGSFNFKLTNDPTESYKQLPYGNELTSKVTALEAKLDRLLDDDGSDVETESENRLGVIGEIIGHPAIAPFVPVLIEKIVSSVFGNGQQPQPVTMSQPLRKVSGIGETVAAVKTDLSLLDRSIDRLKIADPKLDIHLKKLADLAERDPNSFKYIVGVLEGMPE